MTVLAVKNYKDKIEIAADSGIFRGFGRKEENLEKIIEINDIIFASTGLVSESIFLKLFASTRKPESNNKLDILRFFVEFKQWQKNTLDISFNNKVLNNNYFFYFDGKIFHFEGDGYIREIKVNEFASDGAGFQEAKTALYLGHSPKEAVDICIKVNCWAAGETQVKIINKPNANT